MALFRAYSVGGTKLPTYFIESTAPDNVDDPPEVTATDKADSAAANLPLPDEIGPLKPIDPDTAIDEIAAVLGAAPTPNLVVMVHGFNNPRPAVLQFYAAAAAAIERDSQITKDKGLVCVGYRWPSEKMGEPLPSWRSALPTMATWLGRLGLIVLLIGVILILLRPLWHFVTWLDPALHAWATALALGSWIKCSLCVIGHLLAGIGLLLAGLIGCAILLRTIVYFRDTYRATNYGAPDLVEIVRQIDRKIVPPAHAPSNHVALSFIGHSMGGYVVTNAIRVLSDVFDYAAMRPRLNAGVVNEQNAAHFAETSAPDLPSHLGRAFHLMRFVLASPDIPAEALISNRANFLASSLRRFREAYLFSNEGDEVLRQISTVANYFSFPTTSWKFGFRLGNVEILSTRYGIISVPRDAILKTLRVGFFTLQQIYDRLTAVRAPGGDDDVWQNKLAERFSYFDCTDYVDIDNEGVKRSLLTFALRLKEKEHNPAARMSWRQHLSLMWAYLRTQQPNVHAGYFEGQLSQQIIYRLACLGFAGTITAYGGRQPLSDVCAEKQIRVLLSPGL